jgi:regulator of sirC expression with transglutaminase-like and TPR domain
MIAVDSTAYLTEAGASPDEGVDLALTALHLAALNHPGISTGRYVSHLEQTGRDVAARFQVLREAGADDDVRTRLAALKNVIVDSQGFTGAHEDYDNMENADLMRVIDRRCGMPISLAILYIDAARRQSWDIQGLNMPGHFILRLEKDGDRLIFDPFNNCKILQAPDLRDIVKEHVGPQAELSASYYESSSNRQILLRLQNNIKLRQIKSEDYMAALKTVDAMRLIDPEEYRLLLDSGVLRARTGQPYEAIDALEAYLSRALSARDRHDAALLLQHIRNSLQ